MSKNDHEDQKPKRICYLTGRRLKTSEEAYSNYIKRWNAENEERDQTAAPLPPGKEPLDPDRESLEHIIPNAIGGKLKSKHILSHAANQQLNEEIDTEFVKVFSSFTSRLSVSKDRKTKPSTSAYHTHHKVDLIFKDGKYFPSTPFYDEKSKTIYAYPLKNAENYKKLLIRDGVICEGDPIILADDMDGIIEVPFGLDNQNFKRGMAKIAIGYAVFNEIDRNLLDKALDVDNDAIFSRISLVPSFPLTKSEKFFEENVDKSPHFPCHTLTLCGHDGILYCHVELFNAFQWYVVLSRDYQGDDVFHTYTYDLLNDLEISRNDYISSVELPPELPKIDNFRKVSEWRLAFMAGIGLKDAQLLKEYNHFKFFQLSDFTRQHFIYNKAIALGIIKKHNEPHDNEGS